MDIMGVIWSLKNRPHIGDERLATLSKYPIAKIANLRNIFGLKRTFND